MKKKYDPMSELGHIDAQIAECERKLLCPICGKRMIWFVDTLLCPICDWKQLWELKYDHMFRKGEIK